jgi:hypothetical protein
MYYYDTSFKKIHCTKQKVYEKMQKQHSAYPMLILFKYFFKRITYNLKIQ